jgi:hypothetical protein
MSRVPLAVALLTAALLVPAESRAYSWMISHEYTACAACHADPSGGGLLTRYGRAQAELLLRTRYGTIPDGQEPGRVAGFLFGAFEPPDSVLLGGDIRMMVMHNQTSSGGSSSQAILMQSDLAGQVAYGRVRAAGTLGFASAGDLPDTVTGTGGRLIARTYWLGVDLGADSQWVVRAGRLNVPFGLRIIEHTTFVRSATRTTTDDDQQHGLALAYTGPSLRGEVMAILGNYQLAPDAFRQRGYSAYLEWSPRPRLALGASSLVTSVARDDQLGTALVRQAHGAFARYAPLRRLVLLAEVDGLGWSQTGGPVTVGAAGLLQADYELIRGLHLIGTGELLAHPPQNPGTSAAVWGSVAWFFSPHADFRADVIYQDLPTGNTRLGITSILGQLHLFL